MLEIGKIQTLRAERKNDFGFLLSDGYTHEKSVLLPNRFVPEELRPGDPIRVFLMLDSEDRPVATTQMPAAQVGEFAMLRVKEVNRIGAFLDWGVDKDLFVPFREQPERMEAGKRYLVRLYLDPVTGRIAASRRLTRFCREDVSKLMIGQSVKLIVWKPVRLGWRVVVDENYLGLLYENELCRKIHLQRSFPVRERKAAPSLRMRIRISQIRFYIINRASIHQIRSGNPQNRSPFTLPFNFIQPHTG